MAVADGIGTVACTPHILPGVYDNTAAVIEGSVRYFAAALDAAAIPLQLALGADTHVTPDLVTNLRGGLVPTIAGTRYFLLEPPHSSPPPRLADFTFRLIAAGYVPLLTHPERLLWIETHYELIQQMAFSGVLMQLTAGSITGAFGRRARYWAERMLDEGAVDLVATDAHDLGPRAPRLSPAREAIERRLGTESATRLVARTPLLILENVLPSKLRQP
jgi:protein-tyrosine phosphatase